MALGDMPGLNVLNAFNNARQLNMQEGSNNLQQIGAVQGILASQQQQQQRNLAIQREAQLRGVLSSLPPTATSEDVLKAVRPFASADELMKSGDRHATINSNKEMALARLENTRAQGEQMFKLRFQQAKTKEEQAGIANEYKAFNARVNAAKLQYDTGTSVSVPSMPLGGYAPQPPAALTGSAPDQASGIAAINANVAAGGPGGTLQLPDTPAPTMSPQPSAETSGALAAPVPAAPSPQPADAGNLDARDLLLRRIGAPTGPLPNLQSTSQAPAIQASPTSPVDAGIRQMPASVAALPKKMQDKWLADNSGGGIEQTAKGIANYDIAPLSSFAMARPLGAQVMGRVMELNPNFDAKNYQLRLQGESNFQNKNGPMIRGFNVLLNHLETAKDLYRALDNGDVQSINAAKNAFAEQFGQAAPSNLNAAKQFLAAETVKAVSGAAGALGDRTTAERNLSGQQSPAQFIGNVDTIIKLGVGQLQGHEQQYKSVTNGKTDFQQRFLTDKARETFSKVGASNDAMPEFANEASAASANIKPWTRVKIGGKVGTWH